MREQFDTILSEELDCDCEYHGALDRLVAAATPTDDRPEVPEGIALVCPHWKREGTAYVCKLPLCGVCTTLEKLRKWLHEQRNRAIVASSDKSGWEGHYALAMTNVLSKLDELAAPTKGGR